MPPAWTDPSRPHLRRPSGAALALTLALAACDPFPSQRDGGPAETSRAFDPGPGPDAGAPLVKATGSDPVLFRADLEDLDSACWADRLPSGFTRSPCGHWGSIGPLGMRLADGAASRSGRRALEVTFDRNESRAGATLTLSAEAVNVRAWYYFAEGFDFGQGIKVGRVRAFDHATQTNAVDIILTVRSSGDADQCGTTDMADLGLFYNGAPAGLDWGHLIAPAAFERGRWHAVEYRVALNAPGRRDGSVALWVDGRPMGSREGLDLRGRGGPEVRLNKVLLGGWYSNSALRTACAEPSGPSTVYIDDVAVGSDPIGID